MRSRLPAFLVVGGLLVFGAGSTAAAPASFGGAIVFELDRGAGSDIYVSTSRRVAKPLVATGATEFDPALAADGRVAFARGHGGRSEIFVYDSGRVRQLTRDGAVAQQPVWSSDGDRIAYSSDSGDGAEIMEVTVGEPGSARAVAPAPGDDYTPAYAGDGRIAFASNRSGNFDLYVASDGEVTQLTRGPDLELSPVWSPDGSRIAYTRVDARGNADVWLIDVDTRELTRLTRHPAVDSNPSFSPPGDRIAFVSDRAGPPSVWLTAAEAGAKPVPLGVRGLSLGPAWGPTAPAASGARALAASTALTITCPSSGPFAGTPAADTIVGTGTANDTICGLGGNDTLRGLGGNDSLAGGAGADKVFGGSKGDPIVSGGSGRDTISGGLGDDKLFARDGAVDSLNGGPGFDRAQTDGYPPDVNVKVNGVKTVEGVIQ